MKLIKMHGTGNDFLFVDSIGSNQSVELSRDKRPSWVQKICDRHFGIGADGVAFLGPHADYDFAWDFYNADGSSAEMCGNAARCAGLLYSEITGNKGPFQFLTLSGPISAEVMPDQMVSVKTGAIEVLSQSLPFSSSNGITWKVLLLDTGVPHAVVKLAKASEMDLDETKAACAELRASELVGPRGANVTLYSDISKGAIQAVSFERGVEDFTLACGTGVIAAAHAKSETDKVDIINVKVPGGQLRVDFQEESPKLIGPAVKVATVEIDTDF